MNEGRQSAGNIKNWLIAILLACFGLALAFLIRRLRRTSQEKRAGPSKVPNIAENTSRIMGLSSEEVAARQLDFDLEAEFHKEDQQFLRSAVRQSLISTYNIDLFGIALVLYLLGNSLAAVGTLVLVIINMLLNVIQQMYTKRKLNQILKDLRPQAAVIRDGRLCSIDPATIVEGDCLVIRAGDDFLVDGELVGSGEILVEQISPAGEGQQFTKSTGDQVLAGSYCLEGHTIYRAREAGIHRFRAATGGKLQLLLGELTPLQRFMELILRLLFGLVMIIGLLLLADSLIIGANIFSTRYQDAFSIIFGIAPTSLFFILIITYVIGALRISDRGALVYKAQSIETLANTSLLCISEKSLLSKLQVDLEITEPPPGMEPLSENLVRRILGDFIHSLPNPNPTEQMLARALPGEAHTTTEIAPFLIDRGWHGIVFDDPDLSGTFILGFPEVLESNLAREQVDSLEHAERTMVRVQRRLNRWLKRFNRREDRSQHINTPTIKAQDASILGREPAAEKKSLTRILTDHLDKLLSPMEEQSLYESDSQAASQGLQLVFAYLPEQIGIYNLRGEPQLPMGLMPLTRVEISAVVRPEAGQTIRELVEADMQVKILSADSPETTAAMVLELGLPPDLLSLVSGSSLEELSEPEFAQKVQNGNVLGDLKPSQKASIINTLRAQGESVVMVGNTAEDVPAMHLANLRLALRNSAQAALKLTDIVLLKDSLEALPYVLTMGQRLVNGILDIFKLYLSQTVAQLLLILLIFFSGLAEFPYHPTQAGVISLFTIAIPGMFLSVWAAAGRVTNSVIRRQLAHFIIPSALTIMLLTLGVYTLFKTQTNSEKYAQLGVTYALLIAGWLRVLFVQPPTLFWVGGAPLRGDRRVIRVVIGSIILFVVILSIPFFQEVMRITWLRPLDYLIISLAVGVWALITRAIWRSSWLERLINRL